jgi:hypothetical protein
MTVGPAYIGTADGLRMRSASGARACCREKTRGDTAPDAQKTHGNCSSFRSRKTETGNIERAHHNRDPMANRCDRGDVLVTLKRCLTRRPS